MPNSKTTSRPKTTPLAPAEHSPVELVRAHSDALFRAAHECCHQHDRYSRITERAILPIEEKHAQDVKERVDGALAELVIAYEKAAGTAQIPRDDEAMRRANALWLASREFARRHHDTNELTKRFDRHSSDELETLHTEFELEASALLGLRQACAAYQRARPEAL